MISTKAPKKIPTPTSDLVAQLQQLGLVLTADSLDDLVARAATGRWSPRQLLEEIARSETEAAAPTLSRSAHSLAALLPTGHRRATPHALPPWRRAPHLPAQQGPPASGKCPWMITLGSTGVS